MNQDIISIDQRIRGHFEKQKRNVPGFQGELTQLRELENVGLSPGTRNDLSDRIRFLEEKINNLSNEISLGFYIAESVPLLEKYSNILKQPQKLSFMKKQNTENPEKQKVIEDYLHAASKYIDLKIVPNKADNKKVVCESCGNSKNFDIEENIYVCQKCGTVQTAEVHSTSYSDIDRVNMSTKYSYDRKGHFRETMYRYQGKEKCNIDKGVYRELIKQMELHELLEGNSKTPKLERFHRVTRKHVLDFLKELGHDSLYEHYFLIHWALTGQKRNDISHLEEKLMEDFNTLVRLYFLIYKDENQVNRNSFLNTQHIFYELLLKHKHPCYKEDFSLLKTIDRVVFHDTVTEDLFNILNWPYSSMV